MSFKAYLDRLAVFAKNNPSYNPEVVRINVTEAWCRRKLCLTASEPLSYRGFSLLCTRQAKRRQKAQTKQDVKGERETQAQTDVDVKSKERIVT